MDRLTRFLYRLKLEEGNAITYKQAFENIVSFVKDVREYGLQADELLVTETLAGPFTSGGLLVLLQEPLANHPWHEGIDRVIADCPTLDSLKEGIHICSNGRLRLKDAVSVIDLRPFFRKELQPTLSAREKEELNNLLFLAIKAKNPQVILCMGDVCESSELWLGKCKS